MSVFLYCFREREGILRIFEMFSGQRAFRGPSMVETMNAILTVDPPRLELDDVPPGLETIITHCLEKVPSERFQTAQDVKLQLNWLLQSGGVASPTPSTA